MDLKERKTARRPKKLLSIEASPEWAAWLVEFQEHMGMPRSVLVDRALRELAQREGFSRKPPRR